MHIYGHTLTVLCAWIHLEKFASKSNLSIRNVSLSEYRIYVMSSKILLFYGWQS